MRTNVAMSIAMLAVFAGYSRAEDAHEETGWYARPIAIDQATLDVLDKVGANSVGFRFHLPPDTKLTVVIVAKDKKGKRIDELSSWHEVTPRKDVRAFDTSLRLVRCDAGKIIENYRGKVRWVTTINQCTNETWQPNRYTATKMRSGWDQGNTFEAIEPGKNYLLWRVKAYPNNIRGVYDDSPTTFSMQVHFRYEPMKAQDIYSYTGYGDGSTGNNFDAEPEFYRTLEEPRE